MSIELHQYRDCKLLKWEPSQGRDGLDDAYQRALSQALRHVRDLRAAYARQLHLKKYGRRS